MCDDYVYLNNSQRSLLFVEKVGGMVCKREGREWRVHEVKQGGCYGDPPYFGLASHLFLRHKPHFFSPSSASRRRAIHIYDYTIRHPCSFHTQRRKRNRMGGGYIIQRSKNNTKSMLYSCSIHTRWWNMGGCPGGGGGVCITSKLGMNIVRNEPVESPNK